MTFYNIIHEMSPDERKEYAGIILGSFFGEYNRNS
jgi:hypothetical protein